MDLSNPSVLISGMLISTIGLALFVYGKREERLKGVLFGMALMVLPIIVHSLLWMWLAAAACVATSALLPTDA